MLGAPVIGPGEIAYLQSVYPSLDIKAPSSQLNQALLYYLRGYSTTKASIAAGFPTHSTVLKKFLDSEEGQAVLEFIREQHFSGINITRELLNGMLIEAHAKSATATEEIMAIRELGKLNDLYPGTRTTLDVQVTKNIENIKQLQRIPLDELLKLAAPELQALLTPPVPIESSCSRVYTQEELDQMALERDLDI